MECQEMNGDFSKSRIAAPDSGDVGVVVVGHDDMGSAWVCA